jgi:long-chain fatty acid transport protein
MKVKGGDATFSNIPGFLQANGTFPKSGTTNFNATLPLPAVASVGVGYKLNEKVLLALDVNYSFWSAYKELKFEYDDPVNGSTTTNSKRNYVDAPTIRLGAEYMATKNLALRGGVYYDKTPVELGYMTPETPDSDRLGLTAGVGYSIGEKLRIDASFLFIDGREREQTEADINSVGTQTDVLPGTYKIRVIIPGISLSYNF